MKKYLIFSFILLAFLVFTLDLATAAPRMGQMRTGQGMSMQGKMGNAGGAMKGNMFGSNAGQMGSGMGTTRMGTGQGMGQMGTNQNMGTNNMQNSQGMMQGNSTGRMGNTMR